MEFFTPRGQYTDIVPDQFTLSELEVVRRYLSPISAAMAFDRQSLNPCRPGVIRRWNPAGPSTSTRPSCSPPSEGRSE